MPLMLIVLSSAAIIQWPNLIRYVNEVGELRAIAGLLPHAPYLILALGFIMGWRYANAGMILGTATLAVAYYTINLIDPSDLPYGAVSHQPLTDGLTLVLPLNLALCSALIKRRLFTSSGILSLLFLAMQLPALTLFCHPNSALSLQVASALGSLSPLLADKLSDSSSWLSVVLGNRSLPVFSEIPTAAGAAFGLALLGVLLQYIKNKDIRISGFFFAIAAAMLGVVFQPSEPAVIFYFMAAGLILVITTVEASFSMAYMDELTGLPGRRSLNESLLNLGKKFTVAMIDVDHFKKFNDTYGHETGDQVLRLIASRLGKISGGARTFRYGGEEFTAIFAGKSIADAKPHVEAFRKAVESTPFIVRNRKRRKNNAKNRTEKKKAGRKQVKVTVSIGLASPAGQRPDPEKVIKEADKMLYKAKKNGRNRTVSS